MKADLILNLYNQDEIIENNSENEDVKVNYLRVRGAEALKKCIE